MMKKYAIQTTPFFFFGTFEGSIVRQSDDDDMIVCDVLTEDSLLQPRHPN